MKKILLINFFIISFIYCLFPQQKQDNDMRLWVRQHSDFVFVEGCDFVSSFVICDHEVTQGEYGELTDIYYEEYKWGEGYDYPVYNVTWIDAVKYCNKRSIKDGLNPCYSIIRKGLVEIITCDFTANGYRLPTELEWTYAVLGGNNTQVFNYSGSNNIDSVAWYGDALGWSGNSKRSVHRVKSKMPNVLKIYDMTGNVSEWCWNYGEDNPPKNSKKDYTGPDSGTYKIYRGGSAFDLPEDCDITRRRGLHETYKNFTIGFRVVRSER